MKNYSAAVLAMTLQAHHGRRRPCGAGQRTPGEEKAINLCSTCHGPRGITISPEFPTSPRNGRAISSDSWRLSRRRPARKRRRTISCGGSPGTLTPDDREHRRYYSAQPPAPGRPGDPAMIATGKELFEPGVPVAGYRPARPATARKRQGVADFPRLAGQHASYVVRQIEYIQCSCARHP